MMKCMEPLPSRNTLNGNVPYYDRSSSFHCTLGVVLLLLLLSELFGVRSPGEDKDDWAGGLLLEELK